MAAVRLYDAHLLGKVIIIISNNKFWLRIWRNNFKSWLTTISIISFSDRILCMKSIAYRRQDNSFVFLGDHRIRNLYLTFRKHFPSDKAERQSEKPILDPFVQQSDLTYRDKKLRLSIDYLWAPYISSYINDLLNKWKVKKPWKFFIYYISNFVS